jgi:hypothetical protein
MTQSSLTGEHNNLSRELRKETFQNFFNGLSDRVKKACEKEKVIFEMDFLAPVRRTGQGRELGLRLIPSQQSKKKRQRVSATANPLHILLQMIPIATMMRGVKKRD